MNSESKLNYDLNKSSIWYPFSWKDMVPPIVASKANGTKIYDQNGKEYLDAISSWWVNVHGHAHPHITAKLKEQLELFHHLIFANFTHHSAINLAEKLVTKLPSTHKKIFFSDNGSTAVEVALKIAIQYWTNIKSPKTRIVAFRNSYHGDTFGAMSAGGRGLFAAPFEPFLFEVSYIDPPTDLDQIKEEQLESVFTDQTAAFIFEPLVQGVAGMQMHSAAALDRLISYAKEKDIITIADEVMVGFGRTGSFFATDQLANKPDIITLSKGLTGGTLPLGLTTCTKEIFNSFWSEEREKAFFHGHSYTGNPLACQAALASLEIFEQDLWIEQVKNINIAHNKFKESLSSLGGVTNIRITGTILAFELITQYNGNYTTPLRDQIIRFALDRGVLLRPLGNTIYLLPPYCITEEELKKVYQTVIQIVEWFSKKTQ